jgi:hypothetical protein
MPHVFGQPYLTKVRVLAGKCSPRKACASSWLKRTRSLGAISRIISSILALEDDALLVTSLTHYYQK